MSETMVPPSIVYLDVSSGISGDMLLGALLDAGAPRASIEEAVQSLGLPDCRLTVREVRRCGFRATKLSVEHPAEHVHRHLSDIEGMIDSGALTAAQRELAKRLFRRLAEAEARVHGVPLERVHFHEVGAVDSIADIVGTAVAWDWLAPHSVVASPVPVGTGRIRIAHGQVALPAPATAELLAGIPLVSSDIEAELTTPTGAVFLAELVDRFGPLPAMVVERIGYGAGDRDHASQPNVVRLLVGRAAEATSHAEMQRESVWVLETEIDDQSPEQLGFTLERLLSAGALDVYFTPVSMKKHRPGVLLTVLARPADVDRLEGIVFAETTTLGIRRHWMERTTLRRRSGEVRTPWGVVRGKEVTGPDGKLRFAPEFAACRELAEASGVPLRDVYAAAVAAFRLSSADES